MAATKRGLAFNGMAIRAGDNRRLRRLPPGTSLALGQAHATPPLYRLGLHHAVGASRALCVRPQCVPQTRNEPYRAARAGQRAPRNPLQIGALCGLTCQPVTAPFRLDKAEVAGSSPASSTRVAPREGRGAMPGLLFDVGRLRHQRRRIVTGRL
jgi:hypothetical protein